MTVPRIPVRVRWGSIRWASHSRCYQTLPCSLGIAMALVSSIQSKHNVTTAICDEDHPRRRLTVGRAVVSLAGIVNLTRIFHEDRCQPFVSDRRKRSRKSLECFASHAARLCRDDVRAVRVTRVGVKEAALARGLFVISRGCPRSSRPARRERRVPGQLVRTGIIGPLRVIREIIHFPTDDGVELVV